MSEGSSPYLTPEAQAHVAIDAMLTSAGWIVQDRSEINLYAGRGVAVREYLLNGGLEVDYLLFVDGSAVGALEAKKVGATLIGVEIQSAKYANSLPDDLIVPVRPLPFLYESTGVETRFTNGLDPEPRSREVFAVHRAETLATWLWAASQTEGRTFRPRLQALPTVDESALWPAQAKALAGLEKSLAGDRPRSLIQMATGSGKTYLAANSAWRLIRHGGARRVLFLVDRANLGRQAQGEFERFRVPGDGRKFTELYNVQRLTSNHIDPAARVVICTIQRLYSILRGEEELDEELDEITGGDAMTDEDIEVNYNTRIPPETFDVIFVDECHRSIYGVWGQVLDYFDAHIIGLTATPSKQALGFFNQNIVMEYTHEQAVADKVNVDFDVYRIRTQITEEGATVEKGTWLQVRDRATRKKRWEELEDDLAYGANELNANVVAEDQIRTVIRQFRDVYGTELFPGRTTVPKTLIFAKDDSHADDIVRIVREEFGKGNDFCVKITYRTTGVKPEELLAQFRTSTLPRIAVTVDMIATGTDVKPLECLIFMRSVKSKNFFEQMKGRGVRVVSDAELQGVSPGAISKTCFVIIDAVGVTEIDMGEARPLERCKTVPLKTLFEKIATGSRDPDVVSSIASRLNRLERQLTEADRAELAALADGVDLAVIARELVLSVDIDAAYTAAAEKAGTEPTDEQVTEARTNRIEAAVKVLAANPRLRNRIIEVRSSYRQTIDTVSADSVLEAGYSVDATARAKATVSDWKDFIEANKDELDALQILYSKPVGRRLTFAEIRELANAISRPPHAWTPERIWNAYETLEKSRVRGHGGAVLTDLVSLVRFTLDDEDELVPWSDVIDQRYKDWLAAQQAQGVAFNPVQVQWLDLIKDQIAGSLTVSFDDLMDAPFSQHGGLAKARQVFGDELDAMLEDLTVVLSGMSAEELPPGWAVAPIANLVGAEGVFVDGDWVETKDQDTDGDVRLTQLADVGDGKWLDRSNRYLTSASAERLGCTILQRDDVLVARMPDPLGRACLFPGDRYPCVTVVDVAVLRPGSGSVVPGWLAHTINSPQVRSQLEALQSGTTRKRVSRSKLAAVEIKVPPLREQVRIVDELERRLSHVDAAEASLRSSLRRLVLAREATLWSLVLPGVDEPVGEDGLVALPPGWEWSTLGAVADVAGGVTKDSKRQGDPTFVEVPYLRVANVQRGRLELDDVTTIRVHPDKAKTLYLQAGDILFNEGGDRDKLGRGWVWESQIPSCIHQNHVFRARLTESRLEPKFVSFMGNTFGRRWFEAAGKQTTNLASINMTTLKAFPIPLPPDGVAALIVAEAERRLSLIDAAARSVQANLQKANQLRRSLIAAAFRGDLVPQDPDDEPAAALLERIRTQRAAITTTGRKQRAKKEQAA